MADVSQAAIFDASKNYFGRINQQGRRVYDWDLTEESMEQAWLTLAYMMHTIDIPSTTATTAKLARVAQSYPVERSATGFGVVGDALTNNFRIQPGSALVSGRLITIPNAATAPLYDESGEASYADPVNYMFKGTVSGLTVNTVGADYDVIDDSKNFLSNHGLDNCRIMFTSGVEDGNIFDITSRVDGTTLNVVADLSTIVTTDTFVIYPPALSLPASFLVWVVVWFDEVNTVNDSALADPTTAEVPSVRRELRWCVYADSGSSTSGNDPFTDVFVKNIGYVAVPSGTTLNDSHVSDTVVDGDLGTNIIFSQATIATLLQQLGLLAGDTCPEMAASAPFNSQVVDATSAVTFPNFELCAGSNNVGGGLWRSRFTGATITNATSPQESGDCVLLADMSAETVAFEQAGAIVNTELALEAYNVTGGYVANRSMKMGDRSWIRGFQWSIEGSYPTQYLEVYPGELYLGGKLYQLAETQPVALQTAGNYLDTTVPVTNLWKYIYLVLDPSTDDGDSRTAYVRIGDVPDWSGQYKTGTVGLKYQCIGMFLFKNTDNSLGYRVGNTIHLPEDGGGSVLISDLGDTSSWTAMALPPHGAHRMLLNALVEGGSGSASHELAKLSLGYGSTLYEEVYFQMYWDTVDTYQVSSMISFPASIGTTPQYKYESSDTTDSSVNVRLMSIEFDPFHWPDVLNWS